METEKIKNAPAAHPTTGPTTGQGQTNINHSGASSFSTGKSKYPTVSGSAINPRVGSQSTRVTSSDFGAGFKNEARDFNPHEQALISAVLAGTAPVRGKAVGTLAQRLFKNHQTPTFLGALQLAVELLETETDATCETATTLLNDGWVGGIGALLAAARSL